MSKHLYLTGRYRVADLHLRQQIWLLFVHDATEHCGGVCAIMFDMSALPAKLMHDGVWDVAGNSAVCPGM